MGDFFFFTFGPHIWPHILFRHPINDSFTFGTRHYACNNDKCDSIYGWYGCNFQNKWKIVNFGWFFQFFLTFGPHIWPHILSSHPINYHFTFVTLHYACRNEKFYSMYGWYGCNFSNRWKIAIFVWFWLIFGTFGAYKWPHILPQRPYEWLFYL